jgi:hypothetical protein
VQRRLRHRVGDHAVTQVLRLHSGRHPGLGVDLFMSAIATRRRQQAAPLDRLNLHRQGRTARACLPTIG